MKEMTINCYENWQKLICALLCLKNELYSSTQKPLFLNENAKLEYRIAGCGGINNYKEDMDWDLQLSLIKSLIKCFTDKAHNTDFHNCKHCNATMNESLI
jgi:hypothetical protein